METRSLFSRISYATIGVVLVIALFIGQAFAQTYSNHGTFINTKTAKFKAFVNETDGTVNNSNANADMQIVGTVSNLRDADHFDTQLGKMSYTKTDAQTILMSIKSSTIATLYVSGGAVKTLDASGTSLIVTSKVTSYGGSTSLALGGKTLTLTGSGTVVDPQNTGTFDFTTGTVEYAGSTQNVYPATGSNYATLKVNSSGTISLMGNTEVQTDLNMAAGTLAIGANKLTLYKASLTTGTGVMTGDNTSSIAVTGGTGVAVTLPAITQLSDITVDRANGVTLGGDLETNTATLNSGQLQVGAGKTFKLDGTVTFGGGTLKADNSGATVNFASSTAGQKVIPGNYWNLTLSGGVTKDLTVGSNTYYVKGDFVSNAAAHTTNSTTTFNFNGGTQNISADFPYVIFTSSTAGTKTVTGTGPLAVSGAFTNASVLNMGSSISFGTLSGAIDNAGGTIQFAGSNGKIFTTGIVEYNGSNQTIIGHATNTYANLKLSGSGLKTVATSLDNKVATSGNLDIAAGIRLDVTSDATHIGMLAVGGTITNWGTVNVNTDVAGAATLTAVNFNNGDVTHTTGITFTVDGSADIATNLTNYGTVTNNGTITVGD